jgi:hypothetical protein
MIQLWDCWPVRVVKHVARRIKHRPHHHHPIGVTRHARHVGHAVVRHPVTWMCAATVAGGASMHGLGWPEMALPTERPPAAGAPGPLAYQYFPPKHEAEQPNEFFTLPPAPPLVEFPVIGPPVLLPELPAEVPQIGFPPETQPIPEPGSLAMLATAVAVLALIRGGRNG